MTRWHQVIALGIQEVRRRLAQLGIAVAAGLRYFRLCSLLYRATARQPQGVSRIADARMLTLLRAENRLARAVEGTREHHAAFEAHMEARMNIHMFITDPSILRNYAPNY